jgi:Protein of unknown function (DUF2778)
VRAASQLCVSDAGEADESLWTLAPPQIPNILLSMSWTYSQSTGQLTRNGQNVATGYSGTGHGRNNPDLESQRNVGPIPRGRYTIGPPQDTRTHGPHVLELTPDGHNALGRAGFLIHGDNTRHDASLGCVVLPRDIRDQISNSGDNQLEVVR